MSAVLLALNVAVIAGLVWRCVVVGCEGRRRRKPAAYVQPSHVKVWRVHHHPQVKP